MSGESQPGAGSRPAPGTAGPKSQQAQAAAGKAKISAAAGSEAPVPAAGKKTTAGGGSGKAAKRSTSAPGGATVAEADDWRGTADAVAAAGGRTTTGAALGGETVAAVVRGMGDGVSWRKARELCWGGRVTVDGVVEKEPARRLKEGCRVELSEGGDGRWREELVVFADAEVVVVRKPAGTLTVPFERADRDTLLALARVAVRRMALPGGATLRAVQRLDRDTSGLVVFARSVAAQRGLQEQLAAHSVLRRYLAIVHGAAMAGRHETLLLDDRGDGLRGSWGVYRAARGGPPAGARRATTEVAVVERLQGATLISCALETGRQHQIRIHLAEAGHPLLGEQVYIRDYRGAVLPAPRPMLHAVELGFLHPRSGRLLRFEEPPPADFRQVLRRLRPGDNRPA